MRPYCLFLLSLPLLWGLAVATAAPSPTHTVIEFKRSLDTCDPIGDLPISPFGTSRVIHAFNDANPSPPSGSGNPVYHGPTNRGSTSVNLVYAPLPPEPTESDLVKLDLLATNLSVPAVDTYYHCQAWKFPNDTKRHIVKIQPTIEAINVLNVHHMLLYECPYLSDSDLAYKGPCYDQNTPQNILMCNGNTAIAAWAVGGGDFNLPEVAGFPMGKDGTTYVVMEIHYNNPQILSNIVDNSGLTLYHTGQLRKYDAGIFFNGLPVDPRVINIPPQQQAYNITSYCTSDCTNSAPPQGVTIFASLLHAHLAGRAIRVQHIRNGVELPEIDRNDNYDFNFQEFAYLPKPINFTTGDTAFVTCTYNTMDRTGPTVGGFSTKQEMCFAFLAYYPRIPDINRCIGYALNQTDVVVGCDALIPEGGAGVFPMPVITTPLPPPKPCAVPSWGNKSQIVTSKMTSFDPTRFASSVYLDAPTNKYKLYWSYNNSPGSEYIHFAVDVETTGWVGLGVSSAGQMTGADIFMAWVDGDGNVIATDRRASSESLPSIDLSQDVFDVSGMQYVPGTLPPNDNGGGGSNTTAIAVGVAVPCGVILIAGAVFLMKRKQKYSHAAIEHDTFSKQAGDKTPLLG